MRDHIERIGPLKIRTAAGVNPGENADLHLDHRWKVAASRPTVSGADGESRSRDGLDDHRIARKELAFCLCCGLHDRPTGHFAVIWSDQEGEIVDKDIFVLLIDACHI